MNNKTSRLAGAHHPRCPKKAHPNLDCYCDDIDALEQVADARLDTMPLVNFLALAVLS